MPPAVPRNAQPSPLGMVQIRPPSPTTPTTPIPVAPTGGGFLPRVGRAAQAFAAALFAPLQPMLPPAETQEEGPRRTQYTPGYNIVQQPRAAEGLTPFDWLISIADTYDTLQSAIIYIQDEMLATEGSIVGRPGRPEPSQAQISEAEAILAKPDGVTPLALWLAEATWEQIVTDALSIYPEMTIGGDVLSFSLVDGSTMKPVIDGNGYVPREPGIPAYQQVLWGRVTGEWDYDHFIYAPKNRRPRSAYGRSPCEQLIITVNRALRRQTFDLTYYTDGNIPDAVVPAPAEWTTEQIEQMQEWFDTSVSQPRRRRSLHFIPSKTGRLNVAQFKQPILDPEVERFLDQRTLALLGVSPQELGFMNDINRSQGAMQENVGQRRRLPRFRFFGLAVLDAMLDRARLPDCRYQFKGELPQEDQLAKAQVDDYYLRNGTYSTEYIRERDGLKDDGGQRFVYLGTGPVAFPPSEDIVADQQTVKEPPPQLAPFAGKPGELPPGAEPKQLPPGTPTTTGQEQPRAGGEAPPEKPPAGSSIERAFAPEVAQQLADLDRWRKYVARGVRSRPFVASTLPPDLVHEITALLADLPTERDERREEANTIFRAARLIVRDEVPA